MRRIVIDCDPGIDDSQAIMMAYMHPDIQIEALTSVAGNVGVDKTTGNILKILDVLNANLIPVYQGSRSALIGSSPNASFFHGEDGLGEVDLPISGRRLANIPAALGLIQLGEKYPNELELIAIGPLTNLALALSLDPDLPHRYKRLVIMGGAYAARGNTTSLPAEFNIYADPDAAAVVFNRWPELTMLSWEVTLANSIPVEEINSLCRLDNPRSRFLNNMMTFTFSKLVEHFGRENLITADPLAMAVLIEPDIVQESVHKFVQVERCGHLTRGMTVVDWTDMSGRKPNTHIVLKVNYDRFVDLFRMAFV